MTYVCPKCGSIYIQATAWVNPNTNEIEDWICWGDAVFCTTCEKHSDHFITLEDWEERGKQEEEEEV